MPKMIETWQFKSRPEDIDFARIFREAPAGARVLRILLGPTRILAMRKELYDRAVATGIPAPITRSGWPWNPINNHPGRFMVKVAEGATGASVEIPRSPFNGWVFTPGPRYPLAGIVLSVSKLLEWLEQADAWYAARTTTIVEVY